MIEEDDLFQQIFWNIAWLFVLLFLTMIFVNNITLKQLWNPFYSLLSQLKSYNLTKNRNPISIKTNTKEFADLEVAVNTLLKQNIDVFEQQKQFIGNASHELQTPLAIIINKLELLVEKGNLNNEQTQSIGETIRIAERLVKTNKSLLLLSKIENKQSPNNSTLLLNELINQTIADLEAFMEYKEISISFTAKEKATLKMDPALANVLISNLIRNAITHNKAGGNIEIELTQHNLTICNTGTDSPLDHQTIFNRFYKSTDTSDGTGLGLAIVKAICNQYDYTIAYTYRQEKHCFEVNFKK